MCIGFQFYKMKTVLKMAGGDSCTLWLCLMPLNHTLKNGEDDKFYVYVCFTTIKNFFFPKQMNEDGREKGMNNLSHKSPI